MFNATDVYEAFCTYSQSQNIDTDLQWNVFQEHLLNGADKHISYKQLITHVKDEGIKGIMRLPKKQILKKVLDHQLRNKKQKTLSIVNMSTVDQKTPAKTFFKTQTEKDKDILNQMDTILQILERPDNIEILNHVTTLTQFVQCLSNKELKKELEHAALCFMQFIEMENAKNSEHNNYTKLHHINTINNILLQFKFKGRSIK